MKIGSEKQFCVLSFIVHYVPIILHITVLLMKRERSMEEEGEFYLRQL